VVAFGELAAKGVMLTKTVLIQLCVLCLSTRSYITDCLTGYPFHWGNPTAQCVDGNVHVVSPRNNVVKSENLIQVKCDFFYTLW